ncbi:MAG: Lcl C-terminal domain-containing protein [Candidatus Ranarchaeia archaeon]
MKKVIIDGIEYIPKEKEIETWTDPETGLIWESQETDKIMSWKKALEYAKDLGSGWRLPTAQELFSLVDFSRNIPACKITNTYAAIYWSSTTRAGYTNCAWYVDFYSGSVSSYGKSGNYYVRCVKGDKK